MWLLRHSRPLTCATRKRLNSGGRRWSVTGVEASGWLRRVFARAAADIEDPQQAGQRLLQRDYRPQGGHRHLAAAAAAAAVLIGGASYGISAALTGHAPRTATTGPEAAVLTSVKGCTGLKQADGTLEQVNGTILVIKTRTGQQVSVTTTAPTMFAMSRVPLSYITNGTRVVVEGSMSGGTIAAQRVILGRPLPGVRILKSPGTAEGTVMRAGTAGFTLVTASGTRIPVTTSSRTDVATRLRAATVSQLRTGIATTAVGRAGPHRTLSAIEVDQPSPGLHGKLAPRGCSPTSIQAAISAALIIRR